jgi:hypothetical protein
MVQFGVNIFALPTRPGDTLATALGRSPISLPPQPVVFQGTQPVSLATQVGNLTGTLEIIEAAGRLG